MLCSWHGTLRLHQRTNHVRNQTTAKTNQVLYKSYSIFFNDYYIIIYSAMSKPFYLFHKKTKLKIIKV